MSTQPQGDFRAGYILVATVDGVERRLRVTDDGLLVYDIVRDRWTCDCDRCARERAGDDIFGYDVLVPPSVIGMGPTRCGALISVRTSGVTVTTMPPMLRAECV